MENKMRCQSCGMPVSETFGNLGTNKDDSNTREYCTFVLKKAALPIQIRRWMK